MGLSIGLIARLIALLTAVCIGPVLPAAAQTTPPPPQPIAPPLPGDSTPSADRADRANRIDETQGTASLPKVVEPLGPVKLGEDGVVLYGVPLEDYRNLRRQLENPGQRSPAFAIQRIELAGATPAPPGGRRVGRDGQIELTVRLQIQIQDESQRVAAPIALGNLVMRTAPDDIQHTGSGTSRIYYSKTLRQYVCELSGKRGSFHDVEFKMVAPIRSDRVGQSLSLDLPNATAAIELTVPGKVVDGAVSQGEFLSSSKPSGSKTVFLLEGQGGSLQFTWRPGAQRIANMRRPLSARVGIEYDIRSRLDIRATCDLVVSRVGEAIDSFDVRLPPGMTLDPSTSQAGMEVRSLASDTLPNQVETVRVTLDEPSTEPVKARLLAARVAGGASRFQAMGFQVLDASLQQGAILVSSAKGWNAKPVATQGMTRVSPPPTAPLGSWQYMFEGRQRSLQIEVSPAKSRLHVRPTYRVQVFSNQITLQAELRCVLGGADQGGALSIALPGWTIRDLTAEALADLDAVDWNVVEPLEIPLTRTGGEREFVIRIQAARPNAPDADRIDFSFPRLLTATEAGGPAADYLITKSAAQIEVRATDDIELTPDMDASPGLAAVLNAPAAPAAPTASSTASAASVFNYTDVVGEEAALFFADLAYREQSIIGDVTSGIQVTRNDVTIDQQINCRISYVPADELLLNAPLDILQPKRRLAVSLNGEPLQVAAYEQSASEDSATPSRQLLRVKLPRMTIGDCQLQLSYRLGGLGTLESDAIVPLVLPQIADGVNSHKLRLMIDDDLRLNGALDPSWMPDPATADDSEYLAQGAGDIVTVQFREQAANASDNTTVSATWVQTWLQSNLRRDRAVFRIRAGRARTAVQLPSGLANDPQLLKAALDGREISCQFDSSRRIATIKLPSDSSEHVLEMWYSLKPPSSQTWLAKMPFQSPRIIGAVELGQSYWEICVPTSTQLVASPDNLTSDVQWRWESGILQPVASLKSSELEQWMGASTQQPLPAGLKSYLFTTSGGLPEIVLRMAPVKRLLIVVAMLTMLVWWCCMRWAALRSPPALIGVGALLFLVGVNFPTLASGIGQAVLLSAALLAIGNWVQLAFAPAVRPAANERPSEAITQKAPSFTPPPEAADEATADEATALQQEPSHGSTRPPDLAGSSHNHGSTFFTEPNA